VRSNAATLTVPTDTITVSQQPSNTTASVSSYSSASSTLPTGTYNATSYANGKWFATPADALGGDYIATSDDGINWTKRVAVLPTAGTWSKVLYGNGVYLTFRVLNSGSTICATSTDGLAWTSRTVSTEATQTYSHAWISGGGGWFYATGGNTKSYQSQDGVTWTLKQTSGGWSFGSKISLSLDQQSAFLFGSYNFISAVTSSGVSAPTSGIGPFETTFTEVVHDGSSWVGVSGYQPYSWKWDGSSWSQGASFGSNVLFSIAFRNGIFVALTQAGIASSRDGLNWSLRQSVGSQVSSDIVGINAAYASGVVATTAGFFAVVYRGHFINPGTNQAFFVADYSYVYTSIDGIAWNNRSNNYVYGPFAVGGNKVFMNSGLFDIGGLTSANFSAAATTTFGSPALQWQQSTDGGATWSNISNATSSPLSLTPVSADSGKRYRAVFTKDTYSTVNSNSAILTVP
jgi:hypothetical protein